VDGIGESSLAPNARQTEHIGCRAQLEFAFRLQASRLLETFKALDVQNPLKWILN
jgi:hypothetical protein